MKHSSNPAKNEQALLRFLAPLSILPFGAAAASEYGALRTYLQNKGNAHWPLGYVDCRARLGRGSHPCDKQWSGNLNGCRICNWKTGRYEKNGKLKIGRPIPEPHSMRGLADYIWGCLCGPK